MYCDPKVHEAGIIFIRIPKAIPPRPHKKQNKCYYRFRGVHLKNSPLL